MQHHGKNIPYFSTAYLNNYIRHHYKSCWYVHHPCCWKPLSVDWVWIIWVMISCAWIQRCPNYLEAIKVFVLQFWWNISCRDLFSFTLLFFWERSLMEFDKTSYSLSLFLFFFFALCERFFYLSCCLNPIVPLFFAVPGLIFSCRQNQVLICFSFPWTTHFCFEAFWN